MRAPPLLCRTVGAAKARLRASDSGPNRNAPTLSATTIATVPTPTRRSGSTMSQQRPNIARTLAPTRSANGVGCQATRAGSPPSQASIRLCPAAGTARVAPVSTTWSSRSPERVSQTRPCRISRRPPPLPSGRTAPPRRRVSIRSRGETRPLQMSCVCIMGLLDLPCRYDRRLTEVNPMKTGFHIDALIA